MFADKLAGSRRFDDRRLQRYQDSYRLCYVGGPEGIIIELAEPIG